MFLSIARGILTENPMKIGAFELIIVLAGVIAEVSLGQKRVQKEDIVNKNFVEFISPRPWVLLLLGASLILPILIIEKESLIDNLNALLNLISK